MFSQIYKMISRHGKLAVYRKLVQGQYDPETSTVTNTEVNHNIEVYQRQVKANQFNFPNLIGKEISFFYLAGKGINFTPVAGDYIAYEDSVFKIDSVQIHRALGSVELYRIVGVK